MVACDECGFRSAARTNDDLVSDARGFVTKYSAVLALSLRDEEVSGELLVRPEPATWSALEYAAHVRDVFGFYDDRIRRVADEDRPVLAAFGFDAACEDRRYNDQDPAIVAAEVAAAAAALAARLGSLPEGAWNRVGIGSDGDPRTVRVLAERAVHEGHHHLLDVERCLRPT